MTFGPAIANAGVSAVSRRRPTMIQLRAHPRPALSPGHTPGFGALDRVAESPARVLLLSALIVTLASWPIFLRTFVNDDATYALIAHKLNAGYVLYRDAVD